jgi:maleamate amidohydrolase
MTIDKSASDHEIARTLPQDLSLDDDYLKAGFNGKLPFGKNVACIVVDVVQAYLDDKCPLFAPPFLAALRANETLVAASRAAGIPVVFTGVQYGAKGVDGGLFFRKVPALQAFVKGSAFAEFPPTLQPADNDIIVLKQYASAFFGTSLSSTLQALGIDTVLIGGFSTSGCVRATALDALQYGFAPFVIREACGDRDQGPHEANLFDLQAKYAEVVDLDCALQLLKAR